MTIKELYKWAKENNCEEYEVKIQYRDSGGCYNGTDELIESEIVIKSNGVVVV